MPRLHVCSLARIGDTVAKTGARSLVTLLSPGTAVERPEKIAPNRHLYLAVSDIVAPLPGQVLPERGHLDELIDFVLAWDRAEPMVIHCFAGVSRSTAAAYHRRLRAELDARRVCGRLGDPRGFADRDAERAPGRARRRGARTQRADERGDRGDRARRGLFRGDAVRAGIGIAPDAIAMLRAVSNLTRPRSLVFRFWPAAAKAVRAPEPRAPCLRRARESWRRPCRAPSIRRPRRARSRNHPSCPIDRPR